MFTDSEVGLKMRFDRDVAAISAEAQSIVDGKNRQINALMRELAAVRDELKTERAKRLLAEGKLDKQRRRA